MNLSFLERTDQVLFARESYEAVQIISEQAGWGQDLYTNPCSHGVKRVSQWWADIREHYQYTETPSYLAVLLTTIYLLSIPSRIGLQVMDFQPEVSSES